MNDPYQLQKIVLKDNYNHLISQYTFEYNYSPYNHSVTSVGNNPIFKRTLSKIRKLDRNNVVSEITSFEYSDVLNNSYQGSGNICPTISYTSSVWGFSGILKKIISPSGGVVEYNFEVGDYYMDRSEPNYINSILANENFIDPEVQFYGPYSNIFYDTNQNINYSFTISGTNAKQIFIAFGVDQLYPLPPTWDTGATPYVDFLVRSSDQSIIYGTACGAYSTREFYLNPGTYTLQITGSGGKGTASFLSLNHIPLPFNNYHKEGIRIGSIRYYNSTADTNPLKTTKFYYEDFSSANSSSGYYVSPDIDANVSNYIVYKNVKVTNSDDDNGYTKYYYKIPQDYPKESYVVNGSNGSFWPYYNQVCSGLLEKKEVYNEQNKIVYSDFINYNFENIPSANDIFLSAGSFSKLAWLKKITDTSRTYFDNNHIIEESSETNFNVFNFETASTKKILDGNTVEQFFTYPESGYANFSNAHIINVPVIVESKTNGIVVSKTETKFDNINNTLPTSVLATNISDGTTKTTIKFDLYDEKGNILQFTSSAGIPTAIVYGYDKTQPIAKIEGATYAQVSPYIQAIIDASNADAQNPANESVFLTALDNFRKTTELKAFQITTISYDPLIGMTTHTPPNGIREIYQYDANNKLQKIVDMNGIILKEYKYNYKN